MANEQTLLSWFAHLGAKKLVEKTLELEQERALQLQHEQDANAATEAKKRNFWQHESQIRTTMTA